MEPRTEEALRQANEIRLNELDGPHCIWVGGWRFNDYSWHWYSDQEPIPRTSWMWETGQPSNGDDESFLCLCDRDRLHDCNSSDRLKFICSLD